MSLPTGNFSDWGITMVECDNAPHECTTYVASIPPYGITTYATERCDAVATARTAYGSLCAKCYERSARYPVVETYE